MDDFALQFGRLIGKRIAELGLTQEQVAVKVWGNPENKSHVSSYIKGTKGNPNNATVKAFCTALEIDYGKVLALKPGLTLETGRELIIGAICPDLASSPPEETKFIEYEGLLKDPRWLAVTGEVFTTTFEFKEIWSDLNYYRTYEASLVQFKRKGLIVNRIFICDETRIGEAQYESMVQLTLRRHQQLGLNPRVLMKRDANIMAKEMGCRCDAVVLIGKRLILINYDGSMRRVGHEKRQGGLGSMKALQTTEHRMCERAMKSFRSFWPDALQPNRLTPLFKHQLTKDALSLVDPEVETILALSEVYMNLG